MALSPRDQTARPPPVLPGGLVPRPPQPGPIALGFRLSCLLVLGLAAWLRTPAWAWTGALVLSLVAIIHRGRGVTFTNRFAQVPVLPPANKDPASDVAILIPARNEATGIEGTLRAIARAPDRAAQTIVVNDASTDDTPAILARLAREVPGLQVVDAPPRPPGWTGKSHALWCGLSRVKTEIGWLLFLDGRTVLGPHVLRDAVGFAEAHGLDLLCCLPYARGASLTEEWASLLAYHGVFQNIQLDRLNDPALPPVGILGPFILVRRPAYERAGGHAAAPADYFDDLALAYAVRRAGGRLGIAHAGRRLTMRRYAGFADLRPRAIRILRQTSGDSVGPLVSGLALDVLLYVAPATVTVILVANVAVNRSLNAATCALGAGGFLAYWAGVSAFQPASAVCEVSRAARWAYPVGVLQRIFFRSVALCQVLQRQPASWRGRPVVN